jgi:hypothetical protein
MVKQPRIAQPLNAGPWMPDYTRDIERAIDTTIEDRMRQRTRRAKLRFLFDG